MTHGRRDLAAAVDVSDWTASNRELLERGQAGPVVVGELKAVVVAGRGPRADYHVNAVAELFYQLAGDLRVTLREPDGTREIQVPAGGLWLAPAGVPHSPQRPAGTLGLVVERTREPAMPQSFRWYCAACESVVHEIAGSAAAPVDFKRGMLDFYASESARTCGSCGEIVRPHSA